MRNLFFIANKIDAQKAQVHFQLSDTFCCKARFQEKFTEISAKMSVLGCK